MARPHARDEDREDPLFGKKGEPLTVVEVPISSEPDNHVGMRRRDSRVSTGSEWGGFFDIEADEGDGTSTSSRHSSRSRSQDCPVGLGWIKASSSPAIPQSKREEERIHEKILQEQREDYIRMKLQSAEQQTRNDFLQNELNRTTQENLQLRRRLDEALEDRKEAMKMADKAMRMAKTYKDQLHQALTKSRPMNKPPISEDRERNKSASSLQKANSAGSGKGRRTSFLW